MKRKFFLVVPLFACLLIGGRLYQISGPVITPLPLYEISDADQAVPAHLKQFLGRWEGVWGGTVGQFIGKSVDMNLVVRSIDHRRAKIILSYGGNRDLGVEQGFQYFTVPVNNPDKPKLEWVWGEPGISFQFDLINETTIKGKAIVDRRDQTFEITLARIDPYPGEFHADSKNSLSYEYKPPPDIQDGWEVAHLSKFSIDTGKINELVRSIKAGEFNNVHSLLVLREGKLVLEEYFAGEDVKLGTGQLGHRNFNHDSLHDIRSATKSVTSILLGIAFRDELESLPERPASELLGYLSAHEKTKLNNVLVKHLLTMTAGFEWNEMRLSPIGRLSDVNRLYQKGNPTKYVLSKPVGSIPGETWLYNSGLTEMLGQIIELKTGRKIPEYAHEVLFEPLGISTYEWVAPLSWPEGSSKTSNGLRLKARDFAKIGQLVLNGGKWNNQPIVSQKWMKQATLRHVPENGVWSENGIWGYGYQWWHGVLKLPAPIEVIAAVGHGEQRIFIVPSKDMIITLFGNGIKDVTAILRQILKSAN